MIMILALIVSVLLNCLLAYVLYVIVNKTFTMSDTIDNIKDQVDKSLDVLNDCYIRTVEKSQMEVMSDEPIVRDLVHDLKTCREAILLVAGYIASPFADDNDEDEKGND